MNKTNYSHIPNQNNPMQDISSLNTEIDTSDSKDLKIKIEFRNRMTYLIIAITFGLSGISDLAIQYFFKDVLHVQPAELTSLISITLIPWFLKPLFGLITDTVPIFGYRRKLYIILCGVLDFASLFCISFIDSSLILFLVFLFLHNACLSFSTVLGEAIVVELSKLKEADEVLEVSNDLVKKKSRAQNYISYFFFFKYTGSLISSLFKGLLVKYFSFSTIFLISSLVPLMLVMSGIIFIEDRRNKVNNLSENENKIINSNKDDQDVISESINRGKSNRNESSCPSQFFVYIFQKKIMIPLLFTMVFTSSSPSISNAMFYFFNETLHMNSVDLGIFSIFTTIASLIAIAFYNMCLTKKSFKCLITYGILIAFVFSFSSYILVIRYNVKLGIPDYPFILLSNSLLTMISEVVWMPLLSLAAVLSPKNFEGTSISVFMSVFNLGGILANLFGSALTSILHITSKDFSNLPELVLISNFLSLMPLPILYCLNSKYFELDKNEEIIKTEGIEINDKIQQEPNIKFEL